MEIYFPIIFSVVVVLIFCGIGYTYLRLRRVRDYPRERQWSGHGFDVSRVAEQVQRVRTDPVSELRTQPRHTSKRADLLRLVGRVIRKFPYFLRQGSRRAISTNREADNNAA